jgi:hypothetical protein
MQPSKSDTTKQGGQRIKTVNRVYPGLGGDYGMQSRRLSLSGDIQPQMQNRRFSLPSKSASIYPIDPQLKRNLEDLRHIVSMRKRSVDQSIQSNVHYSSSYDDEEKYTQKHRNYDVHQALFALQNITGKSSGYSIQRGNEYTYTKDYIKLSLDYKSYEPYRVNNPVNQVRCLLCANVVQKSMGHLSSHRYTISKVFFPCEHVCVCDTCYILQRSWSKCPLCNSEVKLVVSLSGREKEEYLEWVEEIKPQLPSDFIQEFTKKSRQTIAKAMEKSIEDQVSFLEYNDNTDQEHETINAEIEELETLTSRYCNIL